MEFKNAILSKQLQSMVETRKGFRMEPYGACNGDNRSVRDVVSFEMEELSNEDIGDFCRKAYGIFNASVPDFIDHLEGELTRHFGQVPLYALWLTTKESTARYAMDGDNWIIEYAIPEGALVLSDLGPDGALFASEIKPSEWIQTR